QPGDQRLACARRPADQHRCLGRGDAGDQIAHPRDCGTFAEQQALGNRRCACRVELCAAQRNAALDRREQAFVAPRLDHEIGRAPAHRLDRDGDPAMAGDDDHYGVAVGGDEPVEQREPLFAAGA
ncbi:hypothetical protein BLX88_25680, partial [Bacillus obstructivus]